MTTVQEILSTSQQMIEARLKTILPSGSLYPEKIHEAMAYSIFAGGKRLRPMLCLLSCEAVGGQWTDALDAACALECIHTYSLIHDDLPGMDDDDYRRGQLTNHKVFGEGTAILAGDALLTYAFEILSGLSHPQALQIIQEIAKASGSQGMIGGQVVDILSEQEEPSVALLEYIHHHKTGALITASLRVGAILGNGTKKQLEQLTCYGEKLGLAFQIIDDILDVIGDAEKLGKPVGSDEKNSKVTFPALFGLDVSRNMAQDAVSEACASLEMFGERAQKLRLLAQYFIERDF